MIFDQMDGLGLTEYWQSLALPAVLRAAAKSSSPSHGRRYRQMLPPVVPVVSFGELPRASLEPSTSIVNHSSFVTLCMLAKHERQPTECGPETLHFGKTPKMPSRASYSYGDSPSNEQVGVGFDETGI